MGGAARRPSRGQFARRTISLHDANGGVGALAVAAAGAPARAVEAADGLSGDHPVGRVVVALLVERRLCAKDTATHAMSLDKM